jgi:alkaline phosphatase
MADSVSRPCFINHQPPTRSSIEPSSRSGSFSAMSLSRRSFFHRAGLAAVASTVSAPAIVRAADQVTFRPGDRPRHIIHLVADGMSLATLTCTDQFSQFLRQRELSWLRLCRQPGAASGLMNVRSLNSLVTDSAASASAWGSGSRVVNGAINTLPEGRKLRTLAQLFGEAGWKRGLVTTAEITHATPAGFTVNATSRSTGDDIARQYLDLRMEVLLGGGRKFFAPATRKDKRDLRQDFTTAGYTVMDDKTALTAAPLDRPWLGTFDKSHLPFTVDHAYSEALRAAVPTLAEMTTAALRKLEREDHFLLQIEGGRVDQAAHLNDAAGAFHDQIAFDEALDTCLDFQRRHADTLIVVTTDHGTGNPGLNGAGKDYNQSIPLLHNLAKVRRSHAEMIKQIQGLASIEGEVYKADSTKSPKPVSPERAVEIIRAGTDYRPSVRRTTKLLQFFGSKGDALYDLMNSGTAQFGQLLGNYVGVGWTSLNHTSDYVPLVATGPGAERFQGFIQNVDVFRHYTQLAGIDFKNPTLPLLAEVGPSAATVESAFA